MVVLFYSGFQFSDLNFLRPFTKLAIKTQVAFFICEEMSKINFIMSQWVIYSINNEIQLSIVQSNEDITEI